MYKFYSIFWYILSVGNKSKTVTIAFSWRRKRKWRPQDDEWVSTWKTSYILLNIFPYSTQKFLLVVITIYSLFHLSKLISHLSVTASLPSWREALYAVANLFPVDTFAFRGALLRRQEKPFTQLPTCSLWAKYIEILNISYTVTHFIPADGGGWSGSGMEGATAPSSTCGNAANFTIELILSHSGKLPLPRRGCTATGKGDRR